MDQDFLRRCFEAWHLEARHPFHFQFHVPKRSFNDDSEATIENLDRWNKKAYRTNRRRDAKKKDKKNGAEEIPDKLNDGYPNTEAEAEAKAEERIPEPTLEEAALEEAEEPTFDLNMFHDDGGPSDVDSEDPVQMAAQLQRSAHLIMLQAEAEAKAEERIPEQLLTTKTTMKAMKAKEQTCQCSTADKEEMLREKDVFAGRWKKDWCHWCMKKLDKNQLQDCSAAQEERDQGLQEEQLALDEEGPDQRPL
jgi:hypothetical protein